MSNEMRVKICRFLVNTYELQVRMCELGVPRLKVRPVKCQFSKSTSQLSKR